MRLAKQRSAVVYTFLARRLGEFTPDFLDRTAFPVAVGSLGIIALD